MTKLERYIAPDETVLWRTPTYWQVMKRQILLPGIFMAIDVVPQLFSDEPYFLGFFFWVGSVWLLFVAAYPLGAWSEIVLTDRKLVFVRRFRRPAVQMFERRDISRLEIFEGDLMLVVHGRHGELHRAYVEHDLMPLARAMDIATTRWRLHTGAGPENRRRLFAILPWFVYPAAILLAVFGSALGVLTAIDSHLGPDFLRSTFSKDELGFAAMVFLSITFVFGLILGEIAIGGVRRLLMSPKELAFLRCVQTDPSWLGKMPVARPRSGLGGIYDRFEQACGRLAYGPRGDCAPPEPQRIEPGAFPPPEEDEEDAIAAPS